MHIVSYNSGMLTAISTGDVFWLRRDHQLLARIFVVINVYVPMSIWQCITFFSMSWKLEKNIGSDVVII